MPSPESTAEVDFSIITAVYNVGRYLDAFIASIEGQSFPRGRFEVIAVDDGSTDDSLARLQAWAARHSATVTVLTQPNAGQAAARNAGLERARGTWVTFTDPDDVLAPEYLSEVADFLAANPGTSMIGTRRLLLDDASGRLTDTHPLRRHFAGRNRLRGLDVWPTYFYGSAPCAFFRRSVIEEHALRFDPRVRPHFEDGHFCCRYLLAHDAPAIGFVSTAAYHYRKRSDGTSTLARALTDPDRFTMAVQYGYLDLLREAAASRGAVPEWLQNQILYELSWYFSTQHAITGGIRPASGAVAERFHELMAEICTFLDPRVVEAFDLRRLRPVWRYILIHGYSGKAWHEPYALVDRLDRERGLLRVRYHLIGDLPPEQVLSDGVPISPAAAKSRSITYHGRLLARERMLWVSSRAPLRLVVGGTPLELRFAEHDVPAFAVTPAMTRQALEPTRASAPTPRRRVRRRDALIRRLAQTPVVRRAFKDAWVLMDRVHDADDSGEILFRYLRRKRRSINAWFVVEAGTPDYQRLKAAGYRRVIAHGSLLWKLLMLNARHLISSHADLAIIAPPEILALAEPTWKFTFLQHGVIKDDLSNWLNLKSIDTFVVSTPSECASISGEDTPYVFTSKEVQLTGLPRFDRLRQVGQRFPPEKRDLVLAAPTWRSWLVAPLAAGSQRRHLADDFHESDFITQWLAFLRSEELRRVCDEQGLTAGFLPHPNLQSELHRLDLPAHVRTLSYEDGVQQHFARAAAFITDYSSIAFNAAYLDRPVVYFQFDADRVFGGGHVGRPGYFDYRRDGFGPVATNLDEAVAATVETLRAGREPAPLYQQRIAATFPERDGGCCRRTTEAILASGRRWPVRSQSSRDRA